jgi:hypothetical protein
LQRYVAVGSGRMTLKVMKLIIEVPHHASNVSCSLVSPPIYTNPHPFVTFRVPV